MENPFIEIAYEAELNTNESAELLELAQELCNENPDTRELAITELRKMIFERGQCQPIRTDDKFLVRFLRARNFIVPRAHKLLVRYCTFREQNKYLYDGVDLWSLSKVHDVISGTIQDHPDVGRLCVIRLGQWDPNDYPMEEVTRTCTAMIEIGAMQPKLQVIGSTVIMDLEGLTMRHVSYLTPTVAYQIVCLMGLAVPGRLRSVHIINYSWILNSFFYVFKRFIPQSAWSSIHFHGSDLKSLQKHIRADSLPSRYGGTVDNLIPSGVWLMKIQKYKNEEFVRDMKLLGYHVS